MYILQVGCHLNPGRACGYRCTTLCAAFTVILIVETALIFYVLSGGQTKYSNAFVWQQIFSKNNFHGADKLQKEIFVKFTKMVHLQNKHCCSIFSKLLTNSVLIYFKAGEVL